jgi:phospholipid/cholesterol/gamma-HCH transport system permease protein
LKVESLLLLLIENIGEKTLNFLLAIGKAIKFAFHCLLHIFSPKSYNHAMKSVLIKQIYFTAVEVLPLFITMAIVFGSIIIGVVISLSYEYSLQEQIGSILITFAIDEFSPFFTALLISLRSATAVNTEISVMKVNNELNTLKEYEIDIIDYLFIPRILSGIISVTFLSILFSIIMLSSGYLYTLFYVGMDLHTYKYLLLNALEVKDLVILLIKGVSFGFFIMIIPIYSGMKTQKSYTSIPISALSGMVILFIAIIFIEVLSLIIQFL